MQRSKGVDGCARGGEHSPKEKITFVGHNERHTTYYFTRCSAGTVSGCASAVSPSW